MYSISENVNPSQLVVAVVNNVIVQTEADALVVESVADHVDESVADHVDESVADHVDESVADLVVESVADHVDEFVADHVDESGADAVDESGADAVDDYSDYDFDPDFDYDAYPDVEPYGNFTRETHVVFQSSSKTPIDTLFDRILPGKVISLCLTFLRELPILPVIVQAISFLIEWETEVPQRRSMMSERFHPAINACWITPSDIRDADWLKKKCKLTTSLPHKLVTPDDVNTLFEFIEESKNSLGVTGIKGFVVTSDKLAEKKAQEKATQYAEYLSRKRDPKKVTVPKSRKTCRADLLFDKDKRSSGLSYHPDFVRALKALSKWIGRIHLWFDPWITARSLQIAKSGLTSSCIVDVAEKLSGSVEDFQEEFPLTSVFMALAVSEFSTRKSFTLESQRQGALNKYLDSLLTLVIENEPRGLSAVALVLPLPEIYAIIPKEDAQYIYFSWMKWAPLFGKFLDNQWERGVYKCARRMMRVPPTFRRHPSGYSGKSVNSSGYNAVIDGWNNMVQGIRVAISVGEITGAPFFLKGMQLVADDQFRWSKSSGKGCHPDVLVFDAITRQGIIPWRVVTKPDEIDTMKLITSLSQACTVAHVSLESWLGLPKIRTTDVKQHTDMICGCTVPEMSVECADFLKSLGVFGARKWTGSR
jgi:hypothetical protein